LLSCLVVGMYKTWRIEARWMRKQSTNSMRCGGTFFFNNVGWKKVNFDIYLKPLMYQLWRTMFTYRLLLLSYSESYNDCKLHRIGPNRFYNDCKLHRIGPNWF
jgi:hypothetical protein